MVGRLIAQIKDFEKHKEDAAYFYIRMTVKGSEAEVNSN